MSTLATTSVQFGGSSVRTVRLGGLAPVAMIDTELGARQVENVLGRIAYGGVS